MFAAIAQFLNGIYRALAVIGALFGGGSTASAPAVAPGTEGSGTRTAPPPSSGSGRAPTRSDAPNGKRCRITMPESINARFNDTGSAAWAKQPGGRHLGTDFGAAVGSPVYAPYPMSIVAVGHYTDEGRYGDYVIGHLVDGTEYYSGHLQNVKVGAGDVVTCGQQIGSTNIYNHTHVQLRVNGTLTDFEEYEKAH